MCPDVAPVGTLVEMLVDVAEKAEARATLNLVLSFAATSKFVPVMLTAVPTAPIDGENPLIVGAPVELVTVKELLLVAVPLGAVTLIVPVVAPLGTVTVSCVAVAPVTVAEVPLKLTVSRLAVVLNAVPFIATELPTGPA